MRRSQANSADVELAALFDALAPILIPLDITPARLAQICRVSFVKAGARQAQTKNSGKPHLARIAALTGLSRTEVKRLVASRYKLEKQNPESGPRALRVLSGWYEPGPYSRRGKPRPLRIVGKPPSFFSLCKSHSGDIPYKVILDDLEHRRCIVVSRKQNRVAVASSSNKLTHGSSEQDTLSFAVAFLREALSSDSVLIKRKDKVATSRHLPDPYVEAAITNRLIDLLDQLPSLYVRRNVPKRNILNVFTLVSRNEQKR